MVMTIPRLRPPPQETVFAVHGSFSEKPLHTHRTDGDDHNGAGLADRGDKGTQGGKPQGRQYIRTEPMVRVANSTTTGS